MGALSYHLPDSLILFRRFRHHFLSLDSTMSDSSSISGPRWYAVQTLSNQEGKAKKYLDKFIAIEEMEDYIFDVLMPTETVTEVKSGKKNTKIRKFYPGYVFVNMRLYYDDGQLLQKPWYFVR